MKNFIYFLLLPLFLIMSRTYADPCSTFYKAPSYSNLIEANQENCQAIRESNDPDDKDHLITLSSIFVGQVLLKHPEYLPQCLEALESLSYDEKEIFYRGMHFAEMNDDAFSTDVKLSDLKTMEVELPDEIDYLWSSFYATGDPEYLESIIKIANRNDEALFYAFIFVVDHIDLLEINPSLLKEKIEENPLFLNDYLLIFLALWSLISNADQDKTINSSSEAILINNPNLNFVEKFNKIMQEKGVCIEF